MTPDTNQPQPNAAEPRRSVIDTWMAVFADAGGLVRAEAYLAKQETSENIKGYAREGAKFGAGVLLLSIALIFLAVAGVIALALVLGTLWALLAVAAVTGLLGFWLIKSGADGLAKQNLLPMRTMARIGKDLDWMSDHGPPLPDKKDLSDDKL